MIGRLKGVIAAVGEGQALIDVGGVGYLVHAGSRTLGKLSVGEAMELHVETQMSESAIRLFGFASGEERAWFARLQDAPGVGAKIALSILDTLSLPQLMDAIALGDTAAISRANGVGKKLAERIVTEFKGKPPPMGLFASGLAAHTGA
ncbi:MAG TPA: Holliday junction branch migration protein RuvA, partial [Hyphomonadaceae bacterium]